MTRKVGMLAIALLALGGIGTWIGLAAVTTGGQAQPAQNQAQPVQNVDVFRGTVAGLQLSAGDFSGSGVYDMNCTPVGGGLTGCDAGIQIKGYGLLNFHYVHNMEKEPCIAPGDQLKVTVLDAKGNVLVERGKA